jgi:signal transduction histidine kinase
MKIRTQIIISIIVSVLVISVVGTILFFNYQQLAVASENERLADDIIQGSYALSNLQNDYLLHSSDRSRIQWEEKYNTLQDQFTRLRITDPVQQETEESILESNDQLKVIFSQIVASREMIGSGIGAPANPEMIQIYWNRLGVQTQGMIFDASRLSGLIKDDTSRIQQANTWLIVFMISALLLVILLNYIIVNRHILGSLESLQNGTGIIGSGNLDYSLDESSNDELGDLSRAFNRMTVNLKNVTASKSDLEKEVADRKRAEEELARSNRELQQFAYVSSHDLQEPLRMISSFVQLLEKRYKGKLDQDADEFIGYIVEGTSRMQRMIQDLLTFSRVQSRGVEFAPVDANQVFEKTVFSHQIMIKEAGALVTKDELPTVMGDETQLSQLFGNLIDNAIKFRRAEETPEVHISAQRKGNDWEFSVQDNGIGIDPQYFDRIFIIFQRLHAREAYEGTGIGLAVCMRIVERHGGRIWVESEPGRGSIFHFTLPAVK